MLDERAAAELRLALEALEALVGLRLSERRPAAPPGRDVRAIAELTTRPLGVEGEGEGLPPREAFTGEGPLGELVTRYALETAEAVVIVAALAADVDEKFTRYWEALDDRATPGGLTVDVVRNLCGRTFAGRLAAGELLAADAKLRATGMVEVDAGGAVGLDPDLHAWLLTRPRPDPPPSPAFPARRLRTVHRLETVVGGSQVTSGLRLLVDRIRHRPTVLGEWGFARHHDHAAGVTALFHGPPGTGKSLSAAVVGAECGLPVYRVDLATVVDKYVGETSKNLARVFDRAEARDWVLFFDEADALFGRRAEVSEARDRWANQEVSYLLQRIEDFGGVSILATNFLRNLDEAFVRRLDLIVEFPEPGVAERARLWRGVLPPELALARDTDLDGLAERYPLTGADIRNAAFHAAYLAAADGGVVTGAHLEAGVHAQFGKRSQTLPVGDGR